MDAQRSEENPEEARGYLAFPSSQYAYSRAHNPVNGQRLCALRLEVDTLTRVGRSVFSPLGSRESVTDAVVAGYEALALLDGEGKYVALHF